MQFALEAAASTPAAPVTITHGIAGFEGRELHRNAGGGDPTYQFVNIATWASVGAWRAALPQIIAAAAGGLGGVFPNAALYESVFRFPA